MTNKVPFLPEEGLVRKSTILPLVGMGATKWYGLVKAGKAPQPIKLSPKLVVWDAKEVRQWLAEQRSLRLPSEVAQA